MPNYDRQEYGGRFKLTFVAIAIVHLLALGGLLLVSLSSPSKKEENIVWMNPGSFGRSALGTVERTWQNPVEPCRTLQNLKTSPTSRRIER